MSGTKPTNPKDRVAGTKLPAGLVPDTAIIALSLAFAEGAYKYGRFNWRVAGVSASVYMAAMRRHIMKWWNGQDADPVTRVHHLANAMACCAIVLDAELYGLLNDDRPPAGNDRDAMARAIDEAEATIKHLRELFKDHNPHQPTLHEPVPPVEISGVELSDDDLESLVQEFSAPSDPAALPRIADGRPWGCPWAITCSLGKLLSTHSSYADAEAVLRDMLAPLPVNTPEELAELERARGTVVLVGGPGLVDGGHVEHAFPLFEDGPEMRGNSIDGPAGADWREPIVFERCGHMSRTKRVCIKDASHAGAHEDAVALWTSAE